MTSTQSYAFLMHTDGTFEVLEWPGETRKNLRTLRQAICCDVIDAVTISADLTMWVNTEKIPNGAPLNFPATRLYAAERGTLHQIYHGSVVITGGVSESGESQGLTQSAVINLLEVHMSSQEITIPAQRTR
ncbi:DUF3846 domain-containing protein [Streptomyces sp. NPDC090132]|uniref:DUF3846 domain-containing protein n=1 Tax=Streptomyces sp. NPDC090132 TaxID=3365955 RepID=UPI0038184FC0